MGLSSIVAYTLGTVNLFYVIANIIRISKGTVKNFYPVIIRFVK